MTLSRELYAVALSACIALAGCSGSTAPLDPTGGASLAGRRVASLSTAARTSAQLSPFVFGPAIAAAALRTRQSRDFTHAAATCTPLTIDFPGHGTVSLTAAVVGPVSNATVNAAGCDVGIYLDASASGASLVRDTIVDANQFAVLAIGTQSLGLSNLNIARIGNHDPDGTYDPNGVQTGVGLYFEGVGATYGEHDRPISEKWDRFQRRLKRLCIEHDDDGRRQRRLHRAKRHSVLQFNRGAREPELRETQHL
jgi:hypothetical protein